MPVSGAVKALLSQREWEREGGYGLAESVEAFARSEPFDGELLTALDVCVYALLAWWLARGSGRREDDILLPHGHLDPVRVRRAPLAEAVAGLVGGRRPAIRADSAHQRGFDVYVAEDALVYAKAACEQTDVETPFFLHLVPAGDDFEDGREEFGYNNLDFMLAWHGDWDWLGEAGEIAPCLAEVPLPKYGIAEIRTGQYRTDDLRRIWEGEVRLDQPATEGA